MSDALRLRHPWRETLLQAQFIISVTTIPALLVSIPFGVIVSVQVGSLAKQIGAESLSGAGGLGVIRQGAPMVAALLLAGAVGSAIAADLGARTVREEIDAMSVLGVNPLRRLVAPRIAAVLVVAPLLCLLIIFMGLISSYLMYVVGQDGTPGAYVDSFNAVTDVDDLYIAVIKSVVFGFAVAVISCECGLSAKNGAMGVADSVNRAVVVSVSAAVALNVIITQVVSMISVG
ncbi:MAG: MlaE family ABC transporter permease [Mycobacteriaceae bacterium]